jgi:hypothetical protein
MLVDALRADATRHEKGDFANLGCKFESVELYRSAHPDLAPSKNICIAHTFWDSWIDQCRHGFGQNFYDGIPPAAWPGMAREIVESLESGAPIVNATILRHFDLTGI